MYQQVLAVAADLVRTRAPAGTFTSKKMYQQVLAVAADLVRTRAAVVLVLVQNYGSPFYYIAGDHS